jgi:dihydroorotate dehydrogenase electron transfer subunit
MKQENVEVLWNHRLTPSCYKIGLRASDHFLAAIPGQFIMLRLGDQMDPLLRRPFSIHQLIIRDDVFKGIELLYKVVGAGTQKLAQLSPGDRVDILGPLGNGFFLPGNARQIFIVAGGIGVAPMLFWIYPAMPGKFSSLPEASGWLRCFFGLPISLGKTLMYPDVRCF